MKQLVKILGVIVLSTAAIIGVACGGGDDDDTDELLKAISTQPAEAKQATQAQAAQAQAQAAVPQVQQPAVPANTQVAQTQANPKPCKGSASPGVDANLQAVQLMATEKFGVAGTDSCNPIYWRPIPGFPEAMNGAKYNGNGPVWIPTGYRGDMDGYTCDQTVKTPHEAGIYGPKMIQPAGSGATVWNVRGETSCPKQ